MDALSLRGKIGESDRCEPPSRSALIRRKRKACRGSETATARIHAPPARRLHQACAGQERGPAKFLPAIAGVCGGCDIFGKSCEEILSVDDWLAKAPPKQGSRRGRTIGGRRNWPIPGSDRPTPRRPKNCCSSRAEYSRRRSASGAKADEWICDQLVGESYDRRRTVPG
jgi:hypothetical protein